MNFQLACLIGMLLLLPFRALAEPIILGYFPFWSTYSHSYHIKDVPADRLTHLVYAFANINADGEVELGDKYADVDRIYPGDSPQGGKRGSYHQLRKLKQQYPQLVNMIAIGGWNYSKYFDRAAANPEVFAASAAAYIEQHGFDGIELDWRSPVARDLGDIAKPAQKAQYLTLIKATRKALDELSARTGKTYQLSSTISVVPLMMVQWPIKEMQQHLDFITLLSIDFSGRWNSTTGHYAPLHGVNGSNGIVEGVNEFKRLGGDPKKLVMTIPSQGTSWLGVAQAGINQNTSGVPKGSWDNESIGASGIFSQQDIASFLQDDQWQQGWDDEAKAAWLYHPEQQIWLSYENHDSLEAKLEYGHSQQFAGTALWSLSGDTTDSSSLLRKIHQYDASLQSFWLDLLPYLPVIVISALLVVLAWWLKQKGYIRNKTPSFPELLNLLEQDAVLSQQSPQLQQVLQRLQKLHASQFNSASKQDILPVWQQSRSVDGLHQELVSWFSNQPGVQSAGVYQGDRQLALSESQAAENSHVIQLLLDDLDACVLQLKVDPEHSDEAHFKQFTDQLGQCRQYLMQLCRQPQLLGELHQIAQHKDKLKYIKAERGYSGLYIDGQVDPIYILLRLTGIKLYFDNQTLIQVHRSWLVNPIRVVALEKLPKGKWQLRLDKGECIPVSRSYLPWLQQSYPHWSQQAA